MSLEPASTSGYVIKWWNFYFEWIFPLMIPFNDLMSYIIIFSLNNYMVLELLTSDPIDTLRPADFFGLSLIWDIRYYEILFIVSFLFKRTRIIMKQYFREQKNSKAGVCVWVYLRVDQVRWLFHIKLIPKTPSYLCSKIKIVPLIPVV